VIEELAPIRRRAADYEKDPSAVREIISEGSEAARDIARETLDEVRRAMGLMYS
jgi:tryptophanyl-tRNA synthetase